MFYNEFCLIKMIKCGTSLIRIRYVCLSFLLSKQKEESLSKMCNFFMLVWSEDLVCACSKWKNICKNEICMTHVINFLFFFVLCPVFYQFSVFGKDRWKWWVKYGNECHTKEVRSNHEKSSSIYLIDFCLLWFFL